MVWFVLAAVFLHLMARLLAEARQGTGSRALALLSTLLQGVALLTMATGVFGLLIALVLGLLAEAGPRLRGDALLDMLIWASALVVGGFLLLGAGGGLRRLGGPPGAPEAHGH